jgi:acid phosphatase family membrane protein YuiD
MMLQTPLTAVLLAAAAAAAAGKQAEVLNQVIGELLDGHPVSDVKLKEVLGHTPLQVRPGAARMGRGHVHSWLCW